MGGPYGIIVNRGNRVLLDFIFVYHTLPRNRPSKRTEEYFFQFSYLKFSFLPFRHQKRIPVTVVRNLETVELTNKRAL